MERAILRQRAAGADGNGATQADVVEAEGGEIVESEALAAGAEAASPFAGRGYAPDEHKAYMQFRIGRSFPNVAGPAMSGNYSGMTPTVLERNHGSLVDQQINLEHRIRAYDPQSIPRDRIIGAVVGTSFPKAPGYQGWAGAAMPATPEEAPEITALAVVWKLAEGVRQFLGDHLSGKKPRSVSIEMRSEWEHLGIYVPSSGEIHMLLDAPDELLAAVTENPKGGLKLGKTKSGEQLAWAYGGRDGIVKFHGTGVVERAADRRARIEFIRASLEEAELCCLPTCEVPTMLVDREVILSSAVSGANAWIRRVHSEGEVCSRDGGWRITPTPCDPLLELQTADGAVCYWKLSQVTFAP